MTPSEKAIELVDYFMAIVKDLEVAKKCAIKVCDEIKESFPYGFYSGKHDTVDLEYWNQVIEQIKAIKAE